MAKSVVQLSQLLVLIPVVDATPFQATFSGVGEKYGGFGEQDVGRQDAAFSVTAESKE